jgi:hypothetical protein
MVTNNTSYSKSDDTCREWIDWKHIALKGIKRPLLSNYCSLDLLQVITYATLMKYDIINDEKYRS